MNNSAIRRWRRVMTMVGTDRWHRRPESLAFIKKSRGCTLLKSHGINGSSRTRCRKRPHVTVSYHYHWLIRAIGDKPVDRHPREFLAYSKSRRCWPVSTQFGRVLSSRYHDYRFSLSLFSFFTIWQNWRTIGMLEPEVETAVVNLRRRSSLKILSTTPAEGKMNKLNLPPKRIVKLHFARLS